MGGVARCNGVNADSYSTTANFTGYIASSWNPHWASYSVIPSVIAHNTYNPVFILEGWMKNFVQYDATQFHERPI